MKILKIISGKFFIDGDEWENVTYNIDDKNNLTITGDKVLRGRFACDVYDLETINTIRPEFVKKDKTLFTGRERIYVPERVWVKLKKTVKKSVTTNNWCIVKEGKIEKRTTRSN